MSTSTPYLRIPAKQYFPIFKAGSEDIVLTVEFKNLNQSRVKFKAELFDQLGKSVGLPINTEVAENKSYKKFNVLVKAGSILQVSTTQPGFAVRAYKPALYAKPGQANVGNGQTVDIDLELDADGSHQVNVVGLPTGVIIRPTIATIERGVPVAFQLTRDGVSRSIGAVFFQIATLGIGTAVDVLVETQAEGSEPPAVTGNENPEIAADLVSAYITGRDSVH